MSETEATKFKKVEVVKPVERPDTESQRGRLLRILERVDLMPVVDPRIPDEILGYDESGLPS